MVPADPDLIFLADGRRCGVTAATVAARPGWTGRRAVTGNQMRVLDEDLASRRRRSRFRPGDLGPAVRPAGPTVRGVLLDLLDAVPGVDVDSGLTAPPHAILAQIRLPRVVLGVVVGATLAIVSESRWGRSGFRSPHSSVGCSR